MILGLDTSVKTEHDIDFANVRDAHLKMVELNSPSNGGSKLVEKKVNEAKDHIIYSLT